MTDKERQSCIITIRTLRRLALNIHGVIDAVDNDNCDRIISMLKTEQMTGHWVELPTHESQSGLPWYECSECNSERCIAVLRDFKYCPNCGAKMAESEE